MIVEHVGCTHVTGAHFICCVIDRHSTRLLACSRPSKHVSILDHPPELALDASNACLVGENSPCFVPALEGCEVLWSGSMHGNGFTSPPPLPICYNQVVSSLRFPCDEFLEAGPVHPRRGRLSCRRAPEGVRHLGWLHRTEGGVCRQQRCAF